MLSNPQSFFLPTMPFRREINSGCPVGSTIKVAGKPYEDVKKSVEFSLSTNNNDVALRVELLLGNPAKLKIDCVVSQKTSTAIETLVMAPYNSRLELEIKTLQHSFQIFFNAAKVADFVHRVDPNLIKSVYLKGPLITEEVIISPAVAPPLPSYEQATSPPVELMMGNLSLGNQKVPLNDDLPPPPPNVLQPTASAPQVPITSNPSTISSSFFYTGGSQGFSAHPYPLPGLIDNNTYPSQQNAVNPLAQPTAAATLPSAPPIQNASTVPVSRPPTTVSYTPYAQTPLSTPSVPYTVTFPQSANPTPAVPQPIPSQNVPNPNVIYQNQLQNQQRYPYPAPPQTTVPAAVPTAMPQPAYPPQQAVVPASQVAPVVPYPPQQVPLAQAPPTYIYPTAQPMIQPYPVYQQYPGYGYGYGPEVIYYEGGHHHHRHHFFGHHHHHCD